MANITVAELAKTLRINVDNLLEQFSQAGIAEKNADATISDEEKQLLLNAIRSRKKSATIQLQSSGADVKKPPLTLQKRTVIKRAPRAHQQTQESSSGVAGADDLKARLERERLEREIEAKRTEQALREQQAQQRETIRQKKTAEAAQAAVAAETAPTVTPVNDDATSAGKEKEKKAKKVTVTQRRQPAGDDETPAAKRERQSRNQTRTQLHLAVDRIKKRRKKETIKIENRHGFEKPVTPVIREIKVPQHITIGDLAREMAVKSTDVVAVLFNMGMTVTINEAIDQDTATLLIEEMGHKAVPLNDDTEQTRLPTTNTGDQLPRPPVVTVMGHVDHGKTSLLDHIRKSRVVAGEAGGITQHIGAYQVTTSRGKITFIDTPGHAAFSNMRARGAQVTDIVVLVVAADDGVMPQTVEAIQHARAAEVPVVVAVNKMDVPGAQPDKVKQALSQHNIVPEEWGGEHLFFLVSAKTGEGIEALLEGLALQAELLELRASAEGPAHGVIIEASMETGRGPTATVLIHSGTLHKGDAVLCGTEYGRVRRLYDEHGAILQSAGPAQPVAIVGLSGVPQTGDELYVFNDEKEAIDIAKTRRERQRTQLLQQQQAAGFDVDIFQKVAEESHETLSIVLKADVHGSCQAIQQALEQLSNDEVTVKIVGAGVGGINESDVNLALSTNASVIGFNVRADGNARALIKQHSVPLKYYSIIYELIDDVKAVMTGLLKEEYRDEIIGIAEVRDVFRARKIGAVAGCMVIEGSVRRNNPIRVLRDDVVVFEGALESLKRFKDDVGEVRNGMECGIGVKDYDDVRAGDRIEVYKRVKVQRSL